MKLSKILFVDEHQEIYDKISSGDIAGAIVVLETLDEMSRDDKINKIHSFAVVLLTHLIKQGAQKKTTRSWTDSIENSLEQIAWVNKRHKSGGRYLDYTELTRCLEDAYEPALRKAAQEVRDLWGRRCTSEKLSATVSQSDVLAAALRLITTAQDKLTR